MNIIIMQGTNTNKFLYDMALKNCDNAYYLNSTRHVSFATEGFTYAKNSNDSVYVNYMQYVLDEIDAKINATNELKTAIPYLRITIQ